MLEVSLWAAAVDRAEAAFTFQFENDALQAFLTQAVADGTRCRVVRLQALGTPLVVTGEMPKLEPKPAAKTAGPGAPREPAKPQPAPQPAKPVAAKPATPEKK